MNSSFIRMRRACSRQSEFGYIVPAFLGSVFCLVIAQGRLREEGLDIVEERNGDFTKGKTFALASGICLGFVGRFSSGLAKKHLLPHESFMAFYESLFTCCFALISLIPMQQAREDNYKVVDDNTYDLFWPLFALACLTLMKSLIWERGTM